MTLATSQPGADAPRSAIADRLDILQLTSNRGALVDARDWAALERRAASVQATHLFANSTGSPNGMVAGRDDFGLTRTQTGWCISALILTVPWAAGNQHIMLLAAEGR